MTALRIGVDVGGTNTDAVLMLGREVLAAAKAFTSDDIRSGIVAAVSEVLDAWGGDRGRLQAVMLGTTQFLNAVVQRRGLMRVAAVRVALPHGDGIPPFSDWPEDLTPVIVGHAAMVRGGAMFTGEDYVPLDEDALRETAKDIRAAGLTSVAISAVFSGMRPDIERRAAAIIREGAPGVSITLSSDVGGPGLLDRENAAIINASLTPLAALVVSGFIDAFRDLELACPLYLTQNEGSLLSTEMAARFPIFACSAGPTNSLRGAALLTGLADAVVLDIGGTTTDVGFLKRGFPRETTTANDIGGVRTNFRMPDIMSVGLGGGSIVRPQADGRVTIGPDSVGHRLGERALVFGGDTLTTTDIVVAAGLADIGDRAKVAHLSPELIEAATREIHAILEDAVDRVKTNANPVPLVVVGGGAILVSRDLKGVSVVHRPPNAGVANAIGAASALVSGRIDKLYDVAALGRDEALTLARAEAVQNAVAAGADAAGVDVVDITETPMTYTQSGHVQIKVRAVGPLKFRSLEALSHA